LGNMMDSYAQLMVIEICHQSRHHVFDRRQPNRNFGRSDEVGVWKDRADREVGKASAIW